MPSGDIGKDMDVIRAFYAQKRGKYPELFAVPRLRAEDDPSAGTNEGPSEDAAAEKTPEGPDAEGAEAA